MKRIVLLSIVVILFIGSMPGKSQYSTNFDIMREEELNYYKGSTDLIKMQDLLIGSDYELLIEGNKSIEFTPRHSFVEIQFLYDNEITDHLTLELKLGGTIIDTYEMPVITVDEQIQPGAIDEFISAYGFYIIVFVFLIAVIGTAKSFS